MTSFLNAVLEFRRQRGSSFYWSRACHRRTPRGYDRIKDAQRIFSRPKGSAARGRRRSPSARSEISVRKKESKLDASADDERLRAWTRAFHHACLRPSLPPIAVSSLHDSLFATTKTTATHLCSYGLCSYGPHSYGLYSYGLHSYALYS